MKLAFINKTPVKISSDPFQRILKATEKELKIKKKGEITLIITNDQEVKKLNRDYRKQNQPTDVLSFSYLEKDSFPKDKNLGEIIISIEKAKRQAESHKYDLKTELNKLFIHGILHIFGFKHNLDEEFYTMNSLEEKILKSQKGG